MVLHSHEAVFQQIWNFNVAGMMCLKTPSSGFDVLLDVDWCDAVLQDSVLAWHPVDLADVELFRELLAD